ncbi:MAG: helix-turn-helix domain-containing protein [Pseudomonadota bacterium]|nr:helix-turn-helix domain-containing protein [Pseudomonadota bacterium]MDE3038157.1 helix-turn-helix domain-containing protein [Pseudomonadota bacterium]
MSTDSYSDIGNLLSHARLEFGLSVEEAARRLHIRTRYVEALEEGRLADLPGVIYTKGYLQAYATFLGLDKEEILRRFEQVEKSLEHRGLYFPGIMSREKAPSPLIIWGGASAALVLYFAWLLVMRPPLSSISVFEAFPAPPQERVPVSVGTMADVACLRPQKVYYPPCTTLRHGSSLFSLSGRLVMAMPPTTTQLP